MDLKPTAGGKWKLRWRESGRRRAKTFDRKADALDFDAWRRRQRQLGRAAVTDERVTLAEFVETYWRLHAVPNLASSTRATYRHVWTKHLHPRIGGHELRHLTPKVITRLRADLQRARVGEPTILKSLAMLQSVLSLAVTEERIDFNPVTVVRKPSQRPTRQVSPLAPLEVERIRGELPQREATLVSVLAYAGLRPQEALALRWRDVGQRSLRVYAPKTKSERQVRLLAPLARDLAEYRLAIGRPDDRALVFPRPDGEPMRDHDWRNLRRRVLRPAAAAAGRDDFRPYDLRGSFVSLLVWEGHTVVEAAAQAGHSVQTCSKHYARVFAEYDPADRVSAEEQIRRARELEQAVGL